MDDVVTIVLLSVLMLIGCYLAGCIPLAFSFSESKLRLVTIFGAGLLLGAALAIIIPEGVNSMYESSPGGDHEHDHDERGGTEVHAAGAAAAAESAAAAAAAAKSSFTIMNQEPHSLIGVTLVAGFVFMLLVDQLGGGGHSHGQSSDVEGGLQGHSQHTKGFAATLGLVVHALADGIALGAATSAAQTGLTTIVFVAIMLHKAPASFGLVSFLMHDGLDRSTIRKHLLAFSASAPVGALATFFLLNGQSPEAAKNTSSIGLALLFSAGTFLYVATVHVLPEISSYKSRTVTADGTVIVKEHRGFSKIELLTIIAGSVIPTLISFGHHH